MEIKCFNNHLIFSGPVLTLANKKVNVTHDSWPKAYKLTLTVSQGYLKWWWICEVTEDRHAAALGRFYYIKEDGTRWERSLWWLRTPHLDIHIRYGITVQTIFFTIDVKAEILEMSKVNGAHWQAREIDW